MMTKREFLADICSFANAGAVTLVEGPFTKKTEIEQGVAVIAGLGASYGVRRALLVVPSPIWPEPLYPQHVTVRLVVSAQVCAKPAVMAVMSVSPSTGVGDGRLPPAVPPPIWPNSLLPQHLTVASGFRAHV